MVQITRYEQLQRRVGVHMAQALVGPWRRRSVGVLSLLIGFIIGSNVTMYWFQRSGQNRPAAVLVMVIILEVMVRLRQRRRDPWPCHGLLWIISGSNRVPSFWRRSNLVLNHQNFWLPDPASEGFGTLLNSLGWSSNHAWCERWDALGGLSFARGGLSLWMIHGWPSSPCRCSAN